MSRDAWHVHVQDRTQRIDWIHDFTKSMDTEQFASDLKTRLAVEAAMMQLGEAAGRVPEEIRRSHAEIEWADIRRFRSVVVHVYDQVDPAKLLETIRLILTPGSPCACATGCLPASAALATSCQWLPVQGRSGLGLSLPELREKLVDLLSQARL